MLTRERRVKFERRGEWGVLIKTAPLPHPVSSCWNLGRALAWKWHSRKTNSLPTRETRTLVRVLAKNPSVGFSRCQTSRKPCTCKKIQQNGEKTKRKRRCRTDYYKKKRRNIPSFVSHPSTRPILMAPIKTPGWRKEEPNKWPLKRGESWVMQQTLASKPQFLASAQHHFRKAG